MHKYITCLLLLFVSTFALDAQIKYLDSLYAEVIKETHSFETLNNEVLQFDFYKPKDQLDEMPLIVYVHGGGFVGGVRDSQDIVDFAESLCKKGYAVASVSYRLTMKGIGFGCNVEAQQKIEAINNASIDVSLAIKMILDNPSKFSVDPEKVILAGSSAGAETVLNMAYVLKSDLLPSKFRYAGVIGMAGAVITLDNIDASTAIPTQLFHGTGDRLVPYGIAPHHYCESSADGHLVLYGSEAIANRLKGLDESYYLYTIVGGTHDWASLPMSTGFDEVIDFLYNDIIKGVPSRQTDKTILD